MPCRRLLFVAALGVVATACENRLRTEETASSPPSAPRAQQSVSREEALDSARAFIERSSVAPHVYLDSTAVERVDSLWRVTFRRRQLALPNVVTVDVHARTRAMRFPGDE